MIETENMVNDIQRHYATAAYEKDVARFMQVYAPAVRVFDAWDNLEYRGMNAWRTVVEAWFQSLGTERVRITFAETQSCGSSLLAFSSSIVTYAGIAADGTPLRALQNRLTWGLQSIGGIHRVMHEHTSAPISHKNKQETP